jgi:hypothetical protein
MNLQLKSTAAAHLAVDRTTPTAPARLVDGGIVKHL